MPLRLLQKAKLVAGSKETVITPELIELSIAWARDEIGLKQVLSAINSGSNSKGYVILARSLREAFRKGVLVTRTPGALAPLPYVPTDPSLSKRHAKAKFTSDLPSPPQ